jgi:DNA repair protein RecO (recombination protein O)
MPQVKSEGIILKSVNWKENSRIVTFFTDNAGRQSIIDRGGRSIKSKRGRLQTFSRLEIEYFKSEKSGMGYLSEVESMESFLLEKDGALGRLTFASAALEILNDLLAEDEPHPELYDITIQFLRMTDAIPKSGIISLFLAYFLKTMSYLGYRPNFAGCVSCGKDKREIALRGNGQNESELPQFYFFTPERGGLVCSACQMMGAYYIKLKLDRLSTIYRLQTSSLAEACKMTMKFDEAEEIIELLTDFMKYQTGTKDLNSIKFLEKLKKTKL